MKDKILKLKGFDIKFAIKAVNKKPLSFRRGVGVRFLF